MGALERLGLRIIDILVPPSVTGSLPGNLSVEGREALDAYQRALDTGDEIKITQAKQKAGVWQKNVQVYRSRQT